MNEIDEDCEESEKISMKGKNVWRSNSQDPVKMRKHIIVAKEKRLPKTNRVVQGHLMTVRDTKLGKSLDHYLEDKSILSKKFGKGIAGRRLTDVRGASWSSRQQDLYNGERRFIFAVESDNIGLEWIKKINEAVSNYEIMDPQTK